MCITAEFFKETGLSDDKIKWFNDHFPEECELNIKTSASTTDFIVPMNDGVNESEGVSCSQGVNRSFGVNSSSSVNWSFDVNRSSDVNVSSGVNESYGVNRSDGVNRSYDVNGSRGVNHSRAVTGSFGILNCVKVSNALFLANRTNTNAWTIFGKEVSERDWKSIRFTLHEKLGDWYPIFNNIHALYLKSGSNWDHVHYEDEKGISKLKELSKEEAWAGMPQEAIDFVRSLPQFDADMFYEITGIRAEQLRKGEEKST